MIINYLNISPGKREILVAPALEDETIIWQVHRKTKSGSGYVIGNSYKDKNSAIKKAKEAAASFTEDGSFRVFMDLVNQIGEHKIYKFLENPESEITSEYFVRWSKDAFV